MEKTRFQDERITGIQLTGRHAWPDEQTNAARAYARESSAANLAVFQAEQKKSAENLAKLQVQLGFSYVTDGGFGFKDDFVPYIEQVSGISYADGKINLQPGTMNHYYFIPFVKEKLRASPYVLQKELMWSAIPGTAKKKVTLVSPLSFALAAEAPAYPDRVALLNDFAAIQRDAIQKISFSYDYIQLNESFATDERFSDRINKDMLAAFRDSLNRIFYGLRSRSAIYFSSGDATKILPTALDSRVTDVGFDFNTPASEVGITIDKNLILGLQNVTRKLTNGLLVEEPRRLADKARDALDALDIKSGMEVFLAQSQGSDGLQTYPQALMRDRNLSAALRMLRS